MIVGFTGTRHGMSDEQRLVVRRLLRDLYRTHRPLPGHKNWLVHGDCKGADAQAFKIADEESFATQANPCTGNEQWHADTPSTVRCSPMPPLARNRLIVDLSDILLAAPQEMEEVQRSGTWATIRYAHKVRRHHVIVWPNGETTTGWGP